MNNLNPTNWQEVQADLIAKFNGKACISEFTKLQKAATFQQLFSVVFENYVWLKDRDYEVDEFENITPIQNSSFMVWLLETYCLSKGVDSVVQAVIDLHKQRLSGVEPTEEQWAAASYAAIYAAIDAVRAGAISAARAANSARDTRSVRDTAFSAAWADLRAGATATACAAAWEHITDKLISIIYE